MIGLNIKKKNDGEIVEVTDRMRMFFMGNALVTGIVKRIGDGILDVEKQFNENQ